MACEYKTEALDMHTSGCSAEFMSEQGRCMEVSNCSHDVRFKSKSTCQI